MDEPEPAIVEGRAEAATVLETEALTELPAAAPDPTAGALGAMAAMEARVMEGKGTMAAAAVLARALLRA